MEHQIYRVESLDIVSPHTLKISFDDRTEQTIDFRPVLAGDLYGPLRDLTVFNQVRIDPEVRTLVWPNGADFDPATLHDWTDQVDALTACAQQWNSVPVYSPLEFRKRILRTLYAQAGLTAGAGHAIELSRPLR